jgi:hypothetical protein
MRRNRSTSSHLRNLISASLRGGVPLNREVLEFALANEPPTEAALREALNEVGPLMEEAMGRPLWGSLQGTWQTRAREWHRKHNKTLRTVAVVSSEEKP